MGMVPGRLILTLCSDGSVQMLFMPDSGMGNARPLFLRSTARAKDELVRTFGFAQARAEERIAELEIKGQVDVAISIDEGLAASLFRQR